MLKDQMKKITIAVLVMVVFFLGVWLGYSEMEPEPTGPIYSSGMYDQEFFEKAYEKVGKVDHDRKADSAIIAHHLLVADKMAQAFETVGQRGVETVVVLSPNHFSSGRSAAQISQGNWNTPYGILQSDHNVINDLLEASPILTNEEVTFENEHGIAALTPFIKKSFPNAKIVPIVLHESLSYDQARELGQLIASELPNSFVVGSLDMSHYLPEYVSVFHDAVSESVIAQGGCDLCELEVDSNSVLQTLWQINLERETQEWHKLYRGSAVAMGATDDYQDNTSHLIGYFNNGDPLGRAATSFTFIGDIMLSRYVSDLMAVQGTDYPWELMDRFLSGIDLVVGNFEGTVCDQIDEDPEEPPYEFSFSGQAVESLANYVDAINLANNHTDDFAGECFEQTKQALTDLGVYSFSTFNTSDPTFSTNMHGIPFALIGYNAFATDQEELVSQIQQASDRGYVTIVLPHWGVEYQEISSLVQQDLAEQMVQAGADLIIGTHPHVVQEIGLVESTPVFYSLGNFIFDQDLPGTDQGLSIGAILYHDQIELYLMPYRIENFQPVPINDSKAQIIFKSLTEKSNFALIKEINNGKIIINL